MSTLATAQISLDLNLAINTQDTQHNIPGSITIDEEVIVPVEFNGIDGLIVGLRAQKNNENVAIDAQFFQKVENNELAAVTEVFHVETTFNETASIIVNNPEDDSASLVLTITPTQTE
jgi:hypothetical protein